MSKNLSYLILFFIKPMRFLRKIIGGIFKKVFALDKLKERTIKEGPLRGLFYYGTYSDKRCFSITFEDKVVKVIEQIIDKGNIYDIGAHFGSYSLLFAKLVKEGKVYSFEPNPYCFERLGRTVSLNSLNNEIKIFNFGIGDTNGVEEMMILLDNLANSTCDQGLKYHYKSKKHCIKNIKIKSLDNLNLPEPSLVKIDVEGFEVRVIKGMPETIKRYSPDIIMEIHGKDEEDKKENAIQLLGLLWKFGYHCMHIENNHLLNNLSNDIPLKGHLYASVNKQKILNILK